MRSHGDLLVWVGRWLAELYPDASKPLPKELLRVLDDMRQDELWRAANRREGAPEFGIRRSNAGVWYVMADWPGDGREIVKAVLDVDEGRHWIRTKSAGWLAGRRAPYPE